MLRDVAFENNIDINLIVINKNQKPVKLLATVNISNDNPEPSFLVDVSEHEYIKLDLNKNNNKRNIH